MKRKWIIAAACAVLLSGMEAMACTGLLVGKKASVDGSVMISYAADSHTLYGELYRWPAATWPKGAMLEVREWDTNKPLGQIPQVEQIMTVEKHRQKRLKWCLTKKVTSPFTVSIPEHII